MECQFNSYDRYVMFEFIEEKDNEPTNAAIPPDGDVQDALSLVHLPVEILEPQLLAKLSMKDLINCRRISKFFHDIINIDTVFRHIERPTILKFINKLMEATKFTPTPFLKSSSWFGALLRNANSREQEDLFNFCEKFTQFKEVVEALPDDSEALSLRIREARKKGQKSRLQKIFIKYHDRALTLFVDKIKNLDSLKEFSLTGVTDNFGSKSFELLISSLSPLPQFEKLELEINNDSVKDLSSLLQPIQKLKILSIILPSRIIGSTPILSSFTSLPYLEELHIRGKDFENSVDLILENGKNEADAIELYKGKFKFLKNLKISHLRLSNQVVEIAHSSIWKILSQMENLAKFSLHDCYTGDQPQEHGYPYQNVYSHFYIHGYVTKIRSWYLKAEKIEDIQKRGNISKRLKLA